MKNLLLILFTLSFFYANAQTKHWKDINESAISAEVLSKRTLVPNQARSLHYDFQALKSTLANAPMEVKGKANKDGLILTIPYPDGREIDFKMMESPNMEAGISARYPSIKSYRGVSTKDAHRSIRLVLSPLGIHGVCSGPEGQVYLDPYEMNNLEFVQSYFVKDYMPTDHPGLALGCGVTGNTLDSDWVKEGDTESTNSAKPKSGEVVIERIYRMAIGATGEWTSQLFNSSVADGLAAMNVSVSRINSIWERDLAIRAILIDEEDKLIHTAPGSDPYTMANVGGALLGQNTAILNAIVGAQNYDFGHVYTANCSDVGGIANLASVCGVGKGNGVTCHYSSNLDFVTVSIACHEMGHQLSGNHTFNNCGDNINGGTAYEPGSGSTIMSYCGLCGSQNIQPQADDYYHASTLAEAFRFTTTGNGDYCPEKIETENIRPEVNFPYDDDFFIPIGTPFLLTADGIDENGDDLKYTFEQFTLGPVSDLGSPIGDAPSFRVLYPGDDNFRYFPKLESVINNVTNDSREVLPAVSRDMTTRVTVRDYNEIIGSANWDELVFRATDEAGPFLVTAPNTAEVLTAGSDYEVIWDVANTDGELVNCQRVNIWLSTDGGYNFDKMLADGIPNDGSHVVVLPDAVSSQARIKIEAAENIFYDMSNIDFDIESPAAPAYNFSVAPFFQKTCLPIVHEVNISTFSFLSYDSPITLEAIGAPAGTIVTFSNNPVMPGQDATVTFDFNNIDITEEVSVMIQGLSDAGDSMEKEVIFDIYSNNFSDIALTLPALNAEGVEEVPTFEWETGINALTYTIEIADNPSFSASSILEVAEGIVGNTFSPSVLLPKNVPVYWRIAGVNTCGKGEFTGINVFHTETLGCFAEDEYNLNIIIPVAPNTKEHSITFFDDGTINDLNVANINIDYSPVVALTLTLTGPDGTSIILLDDQCGGTSAVNLGFDDQAPGLLPCPANTGIRYVPIEALSVFNGKNVKGDWTLTVETSESAFNPGKFNGWSLEVCSNISQAGPELINNNELPVKTDDGQVIEKSYLLAEDANNTSTQLIYTLMDGLENGDLFLNETQLEIGDQFSQGHLNSGRVTYFHNGNNETTDFFHFNISDGEGGFIGKTKFDIGIDDNNLPLGTADAALHTFNLFPNPANSSIAIEFIEPVGTNERMAIYDVKGVKILEENLELGVQKKVIAVDQLTPGFYFVRRFNAKGTYGINKLIIQR